jgi:hypothetical protein
MIQVYRTEVKFASQNLVYIQCQILSKSVNYSVVLKISYVE